MADSGRARIPSAHLALLLVIFFPILREWWSHCSQISRISYVLLVPLLAWGQTFFRGRAPWAPVARRDATLGALGILGAALLLAAGALSGVFTLSILAFPLAVTALFLQTRGIDFLRHHAWSFVLFAFLVPIPLPLLNHVNPWLVEASGRTAVGMLRVFDGSTEWAGSVLAFQGWDLVVADACSGSGTFLTLWVLAIFLAGLFGLRPTIALFTLVLTAPLALVVNGLRISASALFLDWWGPKAVSGLPHEILGQVLVIGTAILLVLVASRVSKGEGAVPG